MRLTHLKLSGFKSFVDPTAIHVPGGLVGVVGPNGCGKSNIIDAVRWVLGESRASALRGDTMQDVIFNGSSKRPPVARASVELVFDNSLGRAAGQWSTWAEISVRRVLARDGESNYFINGTHVRRRDVQDIFLGTGLGPRAYAIIEQGMISRIIEARPEDLRVFLEEAAGISKYKERRRETESRLSDTRENLARVEDIRLELGQQIEKLEVQAEVAQRYSVLAAERTHKQNLLWYLRKCDAEAESQRHAREIERTTVELESETAHLREFEKQVEQTRVENYAAADALNAAQGALYAANSEVTRLESELRFVSETRQRISVQVGQTESLRAAALRQRTELEQTAQLWTQRQLAASSETEDARSRVATESARLPEAAERYREAQRLLAAQRERIAQAEQEFQVEQAHRANALRLIDGIEAREAPLRTERDDLTAPDPALAAQLRDDLERSGADLERQEALLQQVELARGEVEARRDAALERLQSLERGHSALDAQLLTLQRIQARFDENERIHEWIERNGLSDSPRLWQKIRVERGWEAAIEAVLREKLHAFLLRGPKDLEDLLKDLPPARVSAFFASSDGSARPLTGWRPLAETVSAPDAGISAAVKDWLQGYYAYEGTPALATRIAMPPEIVLVNRDGHQFCRYGVSFHAQESEDTGVFARQREIEALISAVGGHQEQLDAAREETARLGSLVAEHDQGLATLRAAGAALRQLHHERQIEQLRLTQVEQRFLERSSQIDRELRDLADQKSSERETYVAAEARAHAAKDRVASLAADLDQAIAVYSEAERALEAQRAALQQAENQVQESVFNERECISKNNEIGYNINVLDEQIGGAGRQLDSLRAEEASLKDEGVRAALQQALSTRTEAERLLAAARDRQGEVAGALRAAEEGRFACEQRLQPLRERIGELRLKEQAARITCEQFAAQLLDAQADEAILAGALREGQKAAPLQGEITRLTNAITELGAINMAALDELVSSRERKQFLDAQSADLAEALSTLEGAIRKIDRESRELLQKTFEAVNVHFGELFPALFGGGEARLIMSGEEVLDCGVQVIARPPGKKNSTIHLLSGGEKALTAIALVFAMFQLNPAPFCLLDEVDAPLDDANTGRFCALVRRMSQQTQFLFISHNKITMELAGQLIGVTMQEQGVSRVVAVDIDEALRLREEVAA